MIWGFSYNAEFWLVETMWLKHYRDVWVQAFGARDPYSPMLALLKGTKGFEGALPKGSFDFEETRGAMVGCKREGRRTWRNVF